jgi:hypothetical protein
VRHAIQGCISAAPPEQATRKKKSKLDRFLLRFVAAALFYTHTPDAGINLCVINQARLSVEARRLYFTFTSAQQHFIILILPTHLSPSKNLLDILEIARVAIFLRRYLQHFCLN